MTKFRNPIAVMLGMLLLLGLVIGTPAFAVTDDASQPMQNRVDAIVSEFGGTQTGWNQVSWEDG